MIKHNKCGNEYYIQPNSFLRGTRCKRCDKRKKTQENFVLEVYSLVKNEYTVLGEYINNHTKILMKHNVCGHEWQVIPNNFLCKKSKCPKCFGNIPYTTDSFKQKIKEITGEEYEVLGEYINAKHKILIKHNICGHKYQVNSNNFLNNKRCPKCYKNIPYTTKEFSNKIIELVGNEYTLLSSYINAKTKIKIKHNLCNNEYLVLPSNFLSGRRCPICTESKGEQKIRHWLEDNNINFQSQYTFKDLKNIELLRFDFAILDENNNVVQLIEYDGMQHYKPMDYFGGEKGYNRLKKHDKMKDDYCKNNNISLLRISYRNFNKIEKILEDNLNLLFTNIK